MVESVHSMTRLLSPLLPPTSPILHHQGPSSVLCRRACVLCGRKSLLCPGRTQDWRLAGAIWGAAGLDLGLELSHLLRAGQVLEQVVLLLQL